MPNVTTTTAAPFIPEEWADTALGRLAGTLILGSLVNRDWANTPGSQGDTINIPKRGAVTAAAKVAGTDITPQAPSDSTVQVVLDSHYVASFLIEDIVGAFANQDVGEGYVTDAVLAIAEQIETSGLTAAYTGFTSNATLGTAGVDATEALVRNTWAALTTAKAPMGAPKYCLWAVKDVAALMGLARFTEASILGDGGSAIRSADLGQLFGMRHIASQYVITTGSAPVNTHNVAFCPDALTLAMRPLRAPSAGAVSHVAQGIPGSPTAGLGIRVTQSYAGLSMADLLTVDALWGWKVVRPELGQHILT